MKPVSMFAFFFFVPVVLLSLTGADVRAEYRTVEYDCMVTSSSQCGTYKSCSGYWDTCTLPAVQNCYQEEGSCISGHTEAGECWECYWDDELWENVCGYETCNERFVCDQYEYVWKSCPAQSYSCYQQSCEWLPATCVGTCTTTQCFPECGGEWCGQPDTCGGTCSSADINTPGKCGNSLCGDGIVNNGEQCELGQTRTRTCTGNYNCGGTQRDNCNDFCEWDNKWSACSGGNDCTVNEGGYCDPVTVTCLSDCGNEQLDSWETCDPSTGVRSTAGCAPGYHKSCNSVCTGWNACEVIPGCDKDNDGVIAVSCGGTDCNDDTASIGTCAGSTPACDASTKQCVGCLSDKDCTDYALSDGLTLNNACDTSTNTCKAGQLLGQAATYCDDSFNGHCFQTYGGLRSGIGCVDRYSNTGVPKGTSSSAPSGPAIYECVNPNAVTESQVLVNQDEEVVLSSNLKMAEGRTYTYKVTAYDATGDFDLPSSGVYLGLQDTSGNWWVSGLPESRKMSISNRQCSCTERWGSKCVRVSCESSFSDKPTKTWPTVHVATWARTQNND